LFVLIALAALFSRRAYGAELTLGGQQVRTFTSLDGSSVDEDGQANDVVQTSRLTLRGRSRIVIDVPLATFRVAGDVRILGKAQIAPPPNPLPQQGPVLRFESEGAISMDGTAMISADGKAEGGAILLCAAGDVVLGGAAKITSSGPFRGGYGRRHDDDDDDDDGGHPRFEGLGGTIEIRAGGRVVINDSAASILANGATGGSISIIACAADAPPPRGDDDDDDGGDHGVVPAILIKGLIYAIGSTQTGGDVEVIARRGGIKFRGSRRIDAHGSTSPGAVRLNSATSIAPRPPPTRPAALVCAGSSCTDPSAGCHCEVTLEALRLEPGSVAFTDPNQRQQLRVIGLFSDRSEQDLTDPATGTTYESDDLRLVTVSDSGLAAPIARGQTNLIVRNGEKSASADVTVDFCRPAAPIVQPVASPTTNPSILIAGTAEPGSLIEITTPGGTTTSGPIDGAFAVDTPLAQNRRNLIFVTAIADCGARSSPATVMVTHDQRPPNLFIDAPNDGAKLTNEAIDVAGRVGDLLSGFMGLTVSVNGVPAIVDVGIGNNGTYLAPNVPLSADDPTVLTATATDAAGNMVSKSITVERITISDRAVRMEAVSGNGQTAAIHTLLAQPIVVRVLRPGGAPFPNKIVNFDVTRSDGRLTTDGVGDGTMLLQVRTDGDGLARAFWRLGADAGCGNNRVEVTSHGVQGTVFFCASGTPGPAAQINIGSGNMQRADAGGPAPEPLRAWVSDACNGLENVPVTFRVIRGGGKVNGLDETTLPTGVTGHAQVAFTLGPDRGNNLVEADFTGNPTGPATFVIYGLTRDDTQPTTFTGIVLDNSLLPIGGAKVILHVGDEHLPQVLSGENGQFPIEGITKSGKADLFVDAFNAATLNGQPIPPGSFPGLHYETAITPHAENSLGTPVLLPPLNPNNVRHYSTTQDTVLTCEGMEGLKMIVKAGSMRLYDGTPAPDGTIMTLNQVHHDDVPMPMPDGAAPPFAWTLQPGGATFDPPVAIEYPNMSALPPGAIANFLSFDHDTSKFEIVASGAVSDDGSVILTDPGAGLTVAGWGCNCPPYSVTGDCEPECPYEDSAATAVGRSVAGNDSEQCECDAEDIQEALDLFERAKQILRFGSRGPRPYASEYVEHYLSGGGSLIWGPLDQPGIDARASADYARLVTLISDNIAQKVASALLENPEAPVVTDYILSLNLLVATGIKLNSTFDLFFAINGIQTANSFVVVTDVAINPSSRGWVADVDFDFFDVYSFDNIGRTVPLIEPAGMLLEKCGIAQPFTTNIRVGLVIGGPGSVAGSASDFSPEPWENPVRTLAINGQNTSLNSTADARIQNIVAADSFGQGGPGSPPDFVSDDAMRAVLVIATPLPLYLFTEPFRIRSGETFGLSRWTLTAAPPPSVARMATKIILGAPVILTLLGQTTQLQTLGTMNDGAISDVTPRTAWTVYRTSNPGVVTVGPDGEVTARGAGRSFVTATNEGATAVTSITVALGDPLTTVEGFVQLEDGTPAEGAEVTVPGQGGSATTDATGHFAISGVATTLGDIRVRASKDNLVGTSDSVVPMPGGITDVGFITLRVPATSGREFVVAFQPNHDNSAVALTLFISGDEPTSGEVQIPGIGFSFTFAVSPSTVTGVSLPVQAIAIGTNVTVDRGIHVLADRDINLYGLNRKQFTTDAFTAFPVESLGASYRVMSHTDHFGSSNNNRSQFAVVAVEDDTTVAITPTATTSGRTAGVPFLVTMDRLQVYQLRSDSSGDDLSGSLITSDKPVAVFSGHSCANVPNSSFGFCDHLCEQMPPIATWGKQVLTLPLATRLNGDTFRVLADQDATAVTIAGPAPQNFVLNAGQFAQRILTGNNEITADKPVLVTQFSNGSTYDGVISDPFMTLVPPSEQFLSGYTFTTPGSGFEVNFVNVLARSDDAAASAVLLDGVAIAPASFQTIGATGFSCAKVPIAVGSHTMSAPSPFGIYVYGFADDDSYGYPGGLSLIELAP
jgi:hypothetical protein